MIIVGIFDKGDGITSWGGSEDWRQKKMEKRMIGEKVVSCKYINKQCVQIVFESGAKFAFNANEDM